MTRRGGARVISLIAIAAATASCHQAASSSESEPTPAPRQGTGAPRLPAEQLSAPRRTASDTESVNAEPLVTINTGDHDIDVRAALTTIADAGGFSLVMSPDLKGRVRLKIIDVPVSEALSTVLKAANLTIETGPSHVPWNTSVVFYQLPINVDSLSVEGIMKRFGITRALAEMIVEDRKKP